MYSPSVVMSYVHVSSGLVEVNNVLPNGEVMVTDISGMSIIW